MRLQIENLENIWFEIPSFEGKHEIPSGGTRAVQLAADLAKQRLRSRYSPGDHVSAVNLVKLFGDVLDAKREDRVFSHMFDNDLSTEGACLMWLARKSLGRITSGDDK